VPAERPAGLRLRRESMQLQTWDPPASKDQAIWSRRIQIDSDGEIWFDESEGGKVVRFDPKTESFKEFPLPGPMATPYAMNFDHNHDIWYASEYLDLIGRLDTKTGSVVEYPFPHSENTTREFFYDSEGRMWFATPANNKVGYFYLASQ
jgi:virginiamycin B lyase